MQQHAVRRDVPPVSVISLSDEDCTCRLGMLVERDQTR